MGMNVDTGGGARRGVQPEINVTPLVDVVLVLLIIFMVITPLLTKTFWVHTPKQEQEEVEQDTRADEPDAPLVLRVHADHAISVNGAAVELDELPGRLRRMFAARDDHILFFDAEDDVQYGFAVQVMDGAREGGAVTIATLTTALAGSSGGVPDAGARGPTATPH